jgi:hypothetical protein
MKISLIFHHLGYQARDRFSEHLSEMPAIQQLGCCKLKSDSVLIPLLRIGERLPTAGE